MEQLQEQAHKILQVIYRLQDAEQTAIANGMPDSARAIRRVLQNTWKKYQDEIVKPNKALFHQ